MDDQDQDQNHPKFMHPDAVASVTLVMGATAQGVTAYLDNYGYVRDTRDASFWRLNGAEGDVGLMFSDDWTQVAVVGESDENIENLNYILSRSGWTGARLATCSAAIEEKMLIALSTIDACDNLRYWDDVPAAPAVNVLATPERAAVPTTPIAPPPPPDQSAPPAIRPPAPIVAAASAPQTPRPSASPTEAGLMGIVDKYLLRNTPPDKLSAELIADLQNAGYDLRLTLAPR